MRQLTPIPVFAGLLLCSAMCAQQSGQPERNNVTKTQPKAARTSLFLDPSVLNLNLFIETPPAQDSSVTQSELHTLHAIEQSRTHSQIVAAQADDAEQDIFIYRTLFGTSFTPQNLPILAALSADVHNEEGIAGTPLKAAYSRPRPYQEDKTLHPVCKLTELPNSYPSGHTLSGYLEGFTLAELLPAHKDEILARTDDYAHNRLVCGVHYPSDLAASRQLAAIVFGSMMSNPAFRKRLDAAREELHAKLPSATAER